MSEENTQNKTSTEAPNCEKGREESGGESRENSRENSREESLELSREENRKSLIAFLQSIRFRRGGKGAKVAECDGHFAGLQSKVKRRRSQDETLAIRSAN